MESGLIKEFTVACDDIDTSQDKTSGAQLFGKFGELPIEIRLLIWEYHFLSYFRLSFIHTLNGGFLSWESTQPEPLSSLRLIISRGRLLRRLADRYDWHTRDVPIMQWKTVIHDLSPVSGKIYSVHRSAMATWPKLQPLINHEAFDVARTLCKRYEVIDLWLDNSTINISQPCLADVVSDVFRIDPNIAKMMLGLNRTYWLTRIRKIAIGPFELRGHFDVSSILRILHLTQNLIEVYILLLPAFIDSQAGYGDVHAHGSRMGLSMVQLSTAGHFGSKLRELGTRASDSAYITGDSECAAALRKIVHELRRRCSEAKITYGYLDV